jgi:hypothetical protein
MDGSKSWFKDCLQQSKIKSQAKRKHQMSNTLTPMHMPILLGIGDIPKAKAFKIINKLNASQSDKHTSVTTRSFI